MPITRMFLTAAAGLIAALSPVPAIAQAGDAPAVASPSVPVPADPLTVTIQTQDVERFARLMSVTRGRPSAADIQRGYLDGASYGVSVFTPGRIENAAHLARQVNADPARYERAIRDCLPRVEQATGDLRRIYRALHDLLPEQPLPQLYVVIGAGNSGGTAGPGAQVIGLEVLCAEFPTPQRFGMALRRFFAHETVHTFQQGITGVERSPLLGEALIEGAADFIAARVTGEVPDPDRARWAAPREAMLWREFQRDMPLSMGTLSEAPPARGVAAVNRWLHNYQSAPAGWPSEMGYWIGMRIWTAYHAAAPDKGRAIRDMLNWRDPAAILRQSGYRGGGPD